jgi:GH15 family glucan-1,4-alpha-glucosidase
MTINYFKLSENNLFPFDQMDIDAYKQRLLNNINVCNYGMIAARTSSNSGSGGSYFYCWIRDSSIIINRIQQIFNFEEYEDIVKKYIEFIKFTLEQNDPNGIDMRGVIQYQFKCC